MKINIQVDLEAEEEAATLTQRMLVLTRATNCTLVQGKTNSSPDALRTLVGGAGEFLADGEEPTTARSQRRSQGHERMSKRGA